MFPYENIRHNHQDIIDSQRWFKMKNTKFSYENMVTNGLIKLLGKIQKYKSKMEK